MKRSREPEEVPPESIPPTVTSFTSTTNPFKDGHDGLNPVDNGDLEASPPAAKITELDTSEDHGRIKMHCSLPPHKEPLEFSSYGEYETHYRDQHTNRCLECRKNFPSAHLLGLHIEETHDSFAMVRKERGERTYSCFVEGCDRKCSTPQKRKMHLIDKHMYPKNFFFAVTREGIDGRRSLLQESGGGRRRSSAASAARPAGPSNGQGQGQGQGRGQETSTAERPAASADNHGAADSGKKNPEQQPDQAMEDLSSAMSSLQFVPLSVRFGRGRKAGFARR